MSDLDSMEVIKDLIKFNKDGLLLTPESASKGPDMLYDVALQHAARALAERCGIEWDA